MVPKWDLHAGRFRPQRQLAREFGLAPCLLVLVSATLVLSAAIGCDSAEPSRPRFNQAARAATPTSVDRTIPRQHTGPSKSPVQANAASPVTSVALTESHKKMIAVLREVHARAQEENIFLGNSTQKLQAKLAIVPETEIDPGIWGDRFRLAEAELRLGNEQESLRQFLICEQQLPAIKDRLPPEWIEQCHFYLGVAYMRLAETQNCCQRNTPDSCLLPIQGGGIHERREPSQQAILRFERLLEMVPQNSAMNFRARWLLNIAYMTIGAYPDQVPREWLIPPSVFESDESFPRFFNVASQVGLGRFNLSGGAVADDFDNDGDLDVVISTIATDESLRYYRNDGQGRFEDRTEEAGFEGLTGGLNIVHADYDNDGDLDLLVLRGGWFGASGRHPRSLLQNDGTGRFTDVTFDTALGDEAYPSQTAVWFDFDNDGDLDLYIGNEEEQGNPAPCQLFRNEGNGAFTEIAEPAGVANRRYAKGVTAGDYNGDGWTDLYVSNRRGLNRLYRNNGDGTFTDVASDAGVIGPYESFPTWFWDFDNDGNLDLFVAAYSARIDALAADLLEQPYEFERCSLYKGDGQGKFTDVAWEQNLRRPLLPMGSNFGDLDNDGYLDFYLGTGDPNYYNLMPNVMFRNRGGNGFADVTTAGGFGSLQKGHAVVFADLDHDGDQDVFEQMGGAYPGDRYYNALYENPGFGNHWVAIRLVGVRSNRFGVGSRVRLDIEEEGGKRTIYRHLNTGGSFGANPHRLMVGLGKATSIRRLEVFWPASGETQVFEQLPVDRLLTITEGEPQVEQRTLTAVKLGG